MGVNYCRRCGWTPASAGSGVIHDPAAPWWKFWRTIPCPDCGGDGYAKPKDPPPSGPPAPPPRRYPQRFNGRN